jgi:hypothetical protein
MKFASMMVEEHPERVDAQHDRLGNFCTHCTFRNFFDPFGNFGGGAAGMGEWPDIDQGQTCASAQPLAQVQRGGSELVQASATWDTTRLYLCKLAEPAASNGSSCVNVWPGALPGRGS